MTFSLEKAILWIEDICFLQTRSFSLHKTLTDGLGPFGLLVSYCEVLSSVWTFILTAPIHCRGTVIITGEQVMECYSSLKVWIVLFSFKKLVFFYSPIMYSILIKNILKVLIKINYVFWTFYSSKIPGKTVSWFLPKSYAATKFSRIFLEQQICILKWFLKDHVTLTGVMMLKIQIDITGVTYIF